MRKGNSVITLPLLIAFSTIIIGVLGFFIISLIKPYIMYEKLLSTSLRYMFVLEEYGYLNNNDEKMIIKDLINQGFKKENITINATKDKKEYGEAVELIIEYKYEYTLPFFKKNTLLVHNQNKNILMKVVKCGACKV